MHLFWGRAALATLLAAAASLAAVVSVPETADASPECPSRSARPPASETLTAAARDAGGEEWAQLLQMRAGPLPPRPSPLQPPAASPPRRAEEQAQLLQVRTWPLELRPWLLKTVGLWPTYQSEELKRVLPAAWLHVPKCGTSLINVIMHLPGVCPGIPDDFSLVGGFPPPDPPPNSSQWMSDSVFWKLHLDEMFCPGLSVDDTSHVGIMESPEKYEQRRGRYMTMLRDPEQRTLSSYNMLLWEATMIPVLLLNKENTPWGQLPESRIPNASEFAYRQRGCTVKMLTRAGFPCSDGVPPSQAEVKEAKRRLRTDFSFFGIAEEWALSICLLSAELKVPCLPVMMEDVRPAKEHHVEKSEAGYDLAQLEGVTDPFDREIYEAAFDHFRDRMARHNVTADWCRRTCWKDAGIA